MAGVIPVSKLPVGDGGAVTVMLKLCVSVFCANTTPTLNSSSKQNTLVLMFLSGSSYGAESLTTTVNEKLP